MLPPHQRDEYERIDIDLDDDDDDDDSEEEEEAEAEEEDFEYEVSSLYGAQRQDILPSARLIVTSANANRGGTSTTVAGTSATAPRVSTRTAGDSASSAVDLRTEVHNFQELARKQADKIDKLQSIIDALTKERRPSRKKKSKGNASSSEQEAEADASIDSGIKGLQDHIRRCARRFTYVHRAWPLPSGAWEYTERPQIDPLDYNQRYPADSTKQAAALDQACAAELWDYATVIIRPHINGTLFRPLFDKIIGDQKSKIISCARDMRAEIFAGVTEIDRLIFSAPEPLKAIAADPVCVRLSSATEGPYPSIVYTPGKVGLKHLFKTAAIANMLRLMLFGKRSLRDREKVPDRKTYGMTLAVKTLNRHMIAFAAVCIVHLLNGHEDFDLIGDPSGYPYQKHYEEHIKYLTRAWHTPRVKVIRGYLEDEVFENVWKKSDKVSETTAPPSYPLQPTAEDLLELEDPNMSDSDAGLPVTDVGATAALTREATDLTHSSLTSVPPAPGALPDVRVAVVRASPAGAVPSPVAPAPSATIPGGRPTPTASAPLNPTTSRRPTPIASAPPSTAVSRRPTPTASDPPRVVDGPSVPQDPATMSRVDLSITPTLASITIDDPQPAARARRVQPRPRRAVDPDPDVGEVQPQATEHPAQPANVPLVVPKKARGGRKAKAAATVQDTDGVGASSPVGSNYFWMQV
ncbi:hypothetical protein C8Q73DRAFT_792336 [Cubamyces lactineus]|nr:hypothetical protein C8Q73DRAFT_792336 [Cubamyces lactineus]